MNHGFAIDGETLPDGRGGNTPLFVRWHQLRHFAIKGKQAFSVQYHPEASRQGRMTAFYLFEKFVGWYWDEN